MTVSSTLIVVTAVPFGSTTRLASRLAHTELNSTILIPPNGEVLCIRGCTYDVIQGGLHPTILVIFLEYRALEILLRIAVLL